jgi:CheY-like chemotaxis protein
MKGINAIAVATADDALAQVHEVRTRPDLLICDYNLRGSANGVDTINALREALEWNVPAIVMTGDIRSKIVDSITAPGVSVLIKPCPADDLLQQIARLHQQAVPGDPIRAAEG